MRAFLAALCGCLVLASSVSARGLLVPEDVKLPPLALVNHKVEVKIEDQVAITTVEQSFRNHTDRDLEATYLFPVPKGANVNRFTMWIDGKETNGELLDGKKANDIYTSIVKRTQDPALLEYLGNGLLRLKIYPVPPTKNGKTGDVKVKLSYSTVVPMDGGVVEFVYPLKTDGKGTQLLEEFSVKLDITSKTPIQSVYSPTHAIDLKRKSDGHVEVEFSKNQAILDKDFQLFYGLSQSEIGLTTVLDRPVASEPGYFMMLLSPTLETAKEKQVPRDLVLVVDTSGSMSDTKMSQAKQALKKCLRNLAETKTDRFAILSFSSTVTTYKDELALAEPDQVEKAMKWIDDLRAGGGTAILPALNAAVALRGKDMGRNFTVAFFTDGQPTIDETNPAKIVKAIAEKNSVNTRIFTFGVGDDVNAAMLDQLADATRAVSTYVRPSEDIEAKASALVSKISHPVMTNIRLGSTSEVKLHDLYPVQLPDLFFGGQLVVFGRYSGSGHSALKLSGTVGTEQKELVYEMDFAARTETSRPFIEQLWARRKVGFLLDQIRVNGESKEVVDEVTNLAKKYGIATPYTSYLVVPDSVLPVAQNAGRKLDIHSMSAAPAASPAPGGLGFGGGQGGVPGGPKDKVDEFARKAADSAGGLGGSRGGWQEMEVKEALKNLKPADRANGYAQTLEKVQLDTKTFNEAHRNYKDGSRGLQANQRGGLGVDLAQSSSALRSQERLTLSANRNVQNRNCVEIGGVWIDEQFTGKTKTLAVKAQSEAYFDILAKHPEMKDVYLLGNRFVWIAPNGTALIVDSNDGKEQLDDKTITELFQK